MVVLLSCICLLAFTRGLFANPLDIRQATTSSVDTNALPTAALIETTVGGTKTTITAVAPTPTTSTATSTVDSSSGSASTTTAAQSSPSPSVSPSSCGNSSDEPICEPKEGQTLLVGNTYWVQWNPAAFPAGNTSVQVALQYTNESARVAWPGPVLPKERGFTTVTIDGEWLEGWDSRNFTLVWLSFSPGSSSSGQSKHTAYNVTLAVKPVEHLPPPPPTKAPNKESLMIALPVALCVMVLVVLGLFFGMRSHRKIGLGSVMGRGRRGYGTNKSKRQRLGLRSTAIRLEDREKPDGSDRYHDNDEITTVQEMHNWPIGSVEKHHQTASLGSLVSDGEQNGFRIEVQNQNRGRSHN